MCPLSDSTSLVPHNDSSVSAQECGLVREVPYLYTCGLFTTVLCQYKCGLFTTVLCLNECGLVREVPYLYKCGLFTTVQCLHKCGLLALVPCLYKCFPLTIVQIVQVWILYNYTMYMSYFSVQVTCLSENDTLIIVTCL